MHSSRIRISGTLATLLASAVLLSACSREGGSTAGEKVDSAVAKAEQKGSEMAADARQAGREASQAVGEAADKVASKSKDMAITAEVKAGLARDAQLSALAIEVDTTAGHVVLKGSAPTSAARNQATELARGVGGVVAVDNKLSVQPSS